MLFRSVLDAGCTITATCLTEALNYEQPAMLGRMLKYGGMPSLGTDCDPYFNSSMLWVTRHAFQEQRAMDNRSLREANAWPAKTQHATQTRDAVAWATIGGAKSMKIDHKVGSLAPGKQADIVMVRTDQVNVAAVIDPAATVVICADTSNIDTVFVARRIVKRNGALVRLDLPCLLDRIGNAATTCYRTRASSRSGRQIGRAHV